MEAGSADHRMEGSFGKVLMDARRAAEPAEPTAGIPASRPWGTDLIVGDISAVGNFASEAGLEAFSLGESVCNIGSQNASWEHGTPQHPIAGQNMFRLKSGRFEQIGQAWVFHEFVALAQNLCGCTCNGQGGNMLGAGCSNPHTSGYLGLQENLGPKSEINAFAGTLPFPPSNPSFSGPVARRLQVKISDLDPAQNGGGLYFVEVQYVAAEDSAAGHRDNNASYRPANISGSGTTWNATLTGSTQREKPAIRAWKDHDPGAVETDVKISGEGLLILAAKVTDLGDGFWHYEYALQNLNSDRSAGSFSIPVSPYAIVQNIGFNDVDYHSGEPYDGTDWTVTRGQDALTWSTIPFEVNPDANALRWGTLYNFRFDANVPPGTTDATIGLFKPGTPLSVSAETVGPGRVVAPTLSVAGVVLLTGLLFAVGALLLRVRRA